MVTIEQKLSLFSKLLQQDMSDEIQSQLHALEDEYEEKRKTFYKEVDTEVQRIQQEACKKAESKKIEYVSKAHMEAKKALMHAKEEQIKHFMKKLEEKIQAFTSEKAYEKYLLGLVLECKGLDLSKNYHVYLTSQDVDRYQASVLKAFVEIGFKEEQISISSSALPILGGMMIEDEKKTMRVDFSIATRLRDYKEEIIGRLFSALGEAGV